MPEYTLYMPYFPMEFNKFLRTEKSYYVVVLGFFWTIPALAVGATVYFAKLRNRIRGNWASNILIAATLLQVTLIGVRLWASSIPGGGFSFVLQPYLAYFSLPLQWMYFAGVIGLFSTLKEQDSDLKKVMS